MSTRLRCAIYTRKSTEEGLEQDFNSLHAQREACEAYVASQAGEGWSALKTGYDDGGFSGGSMERPALQQLLTDIEAGKIDVVVVYKVDRITRSLSDFARIVEVFDKRGVSFVSVTQSFNTTSSMGRLTLNVLLSFAQFEREVTGERIRDKISASKAKGMWMGGVPPLGYDVRDRKLVANPTEADRVRKIFDRYLEVGSARLLADELAAEGVYSKAWTTRRGRTLGGYPLTRGAILHILQNPVYIGRVRHRDRVYDGQHEALIPATVFDAVSSRLRSQATVRRDKPVKARPGPLAGKLFDAAGEPMSPSFSYGRSGRLYRYYIALALQTGRKPPPGVIPRVSAKAVESLLQEEVRRLTGRGDVAVENLAQVIRRVELRTNDTHLVIDRAQAFPNLHPELALSAVRRRLAPGEDVVSENDESHLRIVLQRRLRLRGGRTTFAGATASAAEPSRAILTALKRAHEDLACLNSSPLTPISDLVGATAPATMYERAIARLAFLAPQIQQRILTGAHSPALRLHQLLKSTPPLSWADQVTWFDGLASS